MKFLPDPDHEKLISWDQTPVRWLIFYYLTGVIAAVYFIMAEEYFVGLVTPHWMKVVFTAAVFPIGWSLGSVWFYKRGWLR
ncbi:MAG: hypothetical protein GX444_17865 [Myxococcales bacterium]|nr:hypothetical protein [Myxococcales bacterium]